ncbi:MAG: hypothetical protein J6K39_01555 [Clostridia bacterium]|nr:hypothetical protein [Clostridia bacterium]
MFRRDTSKHVIMIQDDNEKSIYDVNDFIDKINKTLTLLDCDDQPGLYHRNALYGKLERDEYNSFLREKTQLAEQIGFLVKILKAGHHPIVLPDAEFFLNDYRNRISKLSGEAFDKAIEEQATLLVESVKIAATSNRKYANAHNLPTKKPAPTKDRTSTK